jgi:tetratricopeptide (TPR) repeat protein
MRMRPLFIFAVAGSSLVFAGSLAPAMARDVDPSPNIDADRRPGQGGVIDIPGIGRIPFPLPPGGSVFGPRVAPQERPAQAPDGGRREHGDRNAEEQSHVNTLDDLFARLSRAGDSEEALPIANLIRRTWAQSGSDTADLLTSRAHLAQSLGQRQLAIDLFDHVVVLAPQWPEAFVQRAQARAGMGDVDGALADLEAAVRLEPRRFDAFAALGALEESRGEKRRALEAYRRSLAIDPKQDDVIKVEEKLRFEVEGRDI